MIIYDYLYLDSDWEPLISFHFSLDYIIWGFPKKGATPKIIHCIFG